MSTSPDEVAAEIHGFSEPDAKPTPWSVGLEQVTAADTFWLSMVRPDGRPHTTPLMLEPIAAAFAQKYGTEIWDFVVRDGAFTHQVSGGRAIVFRVRPVRGLGFRKGDRFSQTTWRFPPPASSGAGCGAGG